MGLIPPSYLEVSIGDTQEHPLGTQTQPFRLTCHTYLLCMVNMAGRLKTRQKNVGFSMWELKIGGQSQNHSEYSQRPNN